MMLSQQLASATSTAISSCSLLQKDIVTQRVLALLPGQERAPTLGAESFPYKGTERCLQLGSDSKNVGSIRPGNSKFTVRLPLIAGTEQSPERLS